MDNKLISDSEIVELRDQIANLSKMKTRQKWQLCQRLFSLLKKAEKDKKEALENRAEALKKNDAYARAHEDYRSAKFALEEAEKEALRDEKINATWEMEDGMRLMRSEEFKIFKEMFDKVAFACKKDPLQAHFSLFVENENEETHNRFGEYFRYDLDVAGVGRFARGKNNKTPTEYAEEIDNLKKEKPEE